LEFDEALRLGRPILLFLMGDDHSLKFDEIERDTEKERKLNAFRERAKLIGPDSNLSRIYAVFNDLAEFAEEAHQSVAELRRYLDEKESPRAAPICRQFNSKAQKRSDPIPKPPAFYPEPPYIGSHKFLGRAAQLEALSDWASHANQYPVLLFEAIGGTGKSILTWEWTTKYAIQVRSDWKGRFWYSFYERGAIMADFCRHALSYMTGRPLKEFNKKKTPELSERLLHQLRAGPWLLVLDGLERVLVSYQRLDAAQLVDEEAGTSDEISDRNPCDAIRPEDDDLIRSLATAAPSKILITTRLTPRSLLNPADQAIPGVDRQLLSGLRPADAEALFRECGVVGDSQVIQDYLQSHCDCHPLVTGVLAGLVANYLPDRGNFDKWLIDPQGGGQLNMANLNLVQKRNHILNQALKDLPEKSRQLLSMASLISEAVDYATLNALCHHEVDNPKALETTIRDLETRGLLQYDWPSKRYDLHPVVRGVAAGGLSKDELDQFGGRVVDHFSQQAHGPYEAAETLDDVRDGLHVVRTLIKMGKHQQATSVFIGDLANALLFNLEAWPEVLSLLHPLFPEGWGVLPTEVSSRDGSYLANCVAGALYAVGDAKNSQIAMESKIAVDLCSFEWSNLRVGLFNMALWQERLVNAERCSLLAFDLATWTKDQAGVFRGRLDRFYNLSLFGRFEEAEEFWKLLDPMGRKWAWADYRPGNAESYRAISLFWRGDLEEHHLIHAEKLAWEGRNRQAIHRLLALRGQWRLRENNWELAVESLKEAVTMAREVGEFDSGAETQLALAKYHLGQLDNPKAEAERLTTARQISALDLGELWFAIGDTEQARIYALKAYKWAWADGEPYVRCYELNRATDLLNRIGEPIPDLPPYDSSTYEKIPWEDEIVAAIEKLKREKAEKEAKDES
jgi:hypothetical protein